jgi:hypothetical protein
LILDLITFTFVRSSGPGGQNVNKGKLKDILFFFNAITKNIDPSPKVDKPSKFLIE